MQTGIKVHSPACTPTCRLVTLYFERARCCTIDFVLCMHSIIHIVTRIHSKKVTLVAMVRVFIIPIIKPLLQISSLAYLIRLQPRQGILCLSDEISIYPQFLSCVSCISETFTNHCQIRKTAIASSAMVTFWRDKDILWRSGWCRNQIFCSFHPHVLSSNQPFQTEFSSPFKHWIILLQELLVKRECVMFPNVCAHPCATHIPVCP